MIGALERLAFGHRAAVLALCAAATAAGAAAASRLEVGIELEALLPAGQPIVRTYLEHRGRLRGLGSALHVVVERRRGDVWDPAYLEVLREVGDELAVLPGVDRAWVRSLWMPAVRFTEVTEEGLRGGPVMPDGWDGSPAALAALRRNVRRAGLAGDLVGRDERSAAIVVPLVERDPSTGAPPDPAALHAAVERLRARLEAGPDGVIVRAVGQPELAGVLAAGVRAMSLRFAAAAAIALLLVLGATRCPRSTLLVGGCSLAAVTWQLGLSAALGLRLDPYSALVPFLVFALGLSHGAQKMYGVLRAVGAGATPEQAARATFRRLFGTGVAALLTDAVGFAALWAIDVPAIRRLALSAGLGVGALVVTSLVLLPVLLSLTGVSPAAAARAARAARGEGARAWRLLDGLTARPRAAAVLAGAALVAGAALWSARGLEAGDARLGAPELREGDRYNQDEAYLADHYDLGVDRLAVLVRTAPDGCADHRTLVEADRLAWALAQVPGVKATVSLPDAVRRFTAAGFEGHPRWSVLSRDQRVLDSAVQQAITARPELLDADCSVVPVVAYLADHRAATLAPVFAAAAAFAAAHGGEGREFLIGAGSAAFHEATRREVAEAGWLMTLLAYGSVVVLCGLALRSLRGVVVTVLPLVVTSALCAGLMAGLGMGVTLATLPAIALGAGIPDHALYLLSVQLALQREGVPLAEAHRRSLRTTGGAVVLVGVTLTCGVAAWATSPIRMQADLGLLLGFMFLGSVAGALVLIPALSAFLLADEGRARR